MAKHISSVSLLLALSCAAVGVSCSRATSDSQAEFAVQNASAAEPAKETQPKVELAKATFGSGCFWCTEAVFHRIKGVASAVSGYSGGRVPDPSYQAVCTGLTGHAEVIQVTFDPEVVSYKELLEIFWSTHDPTTLNRQGADTGTQYRSVVFYHDEEQRKLAEAYKAKLDKAGVYPDPIVTEISPFTAFYAAEEDHQDFYELNSQGQYCSYVITPKIEKLKKVFQDKLK